MGYQRYAPSSHAGCKKCDSWSGSGNPPTSAALTPGQGGSGPAAVASRRRGIEEEQNVLQYLDRTMQAHATKLKEMEAAVEGALREAGAMRSREEEAHAYLLQAAQQQARTLMVQESDGMLANMGEAARQYVSIVHARFPKSHEVARAARRRLFVSTAEMSRYGPERGIPTEITQECALILADMRAEKSVEARLEPLIAAVEVERELAAKAQLNSALRPYLETVVREQLSRGELTHARFTHNGKSVQVGTHDIGFGILVDE